MQSLRQRPARIVAAIFRADRPTGPRCVIGGRRCTGTTAQNHPVVWLDDPRRHITNALHARFKAVAVPLVE
jgi:hypothetical protein